MTSLDNFLDGLLSRGRAYFSREEVLAAIGLSPKAFIAAANRLTKKQRLVSPRRGFYLILRPEDRVSGPDPVRWIDPLMKYLGIDYRISLLRAAAFHGSSHQATMVFQVIAPKQLQSFDLGRHRLQFIYQTSMTFAKINVPDMLEQIKSDAGFSKVAGVELTLLDCIRYFHKAAGINGVAQIVKDLGAKANPDKLKKAAEFYENSAVRRLGYLLEYMGYKRQAKVLAPFVKKAKSMKPLDPSVKPFSELFTQLQKTNIKDDKWMLVINEPVDVEF